MEPTALVLFAGALLITAGSPGPSVAVLVSQVLSRGAGAVVPFVAAMWIGEAAWLAASIAGLAVIAERLHLLFLVIKWAGLAWLVVLAVRMWRAPVETEAVAAGPRHAAGSAVAQFASGLALTLGNPKIMVFYLALLPSLVDVGRIGVVAWAELTTVQVAVMAACDLTWIFFAVRLRGLLRSPRALRWSNRTGAVAMGGAAAVIAIRS